MLVPLGVEINPTSPDSGEVLPGKMFLKTYQHNCGKLSVKKMLNLQDFWKNFPVNPPQKGGIPQRIEKFSPKNVEKPFLLFAQKN